MFIGKGVTFMPPCYTNIGAYIDEGSMVDSLALVGSCAQIGKNVHLGAGVIIGGVLEPVGAYPVIIEDNVFVGAGSQITEGTIVKEKAVIGAGVTITGSTPVYDNVNGKIILPNEKDDVFYNPKIQSYLLLGGHPLHYSFSNSVFKRNGYIGFGLFTNGGLSYLYVLDLNKNELLINPETGNAQFISYAYGFPIYRDSTTEPILTIYKGPQRSERVTYSLKELSKNTVPAFKPGSAPITIGKGENARNIETASSKNLNREPATVGKINETVIKEMIKRSLSKTLNEDLI